MEKAGADDSSSIPAGGRAIILTGPPGAGKSTVARLLVSNFRARFMSGVTIQRANSLKEMPMTIASRVGVHLPEGLLVRLISLAYRRLEPEIRRLDEVCGRGGTMLDIGGWYGPWTRRMARRAERVVTIEPTPLHEVLQRTVPPNVEVIGAAASDRVGETEIWLAPWGSGAEGVSSLHRREIHGVSKKVALITVDQLALDEVSFMKIDVEGHEIPVLRGAMETIKRCRPRLFIEVEERIQPVATLNDLLESLDYHGWVRPSRVWVPLSAFDLVAHQAQTCRVAERGVARRTLWPYPRYVNSVLFLPHNRSPLQAIRPAHELAGGANVMP